VAGSVQPTTADALAEALLVDAPASDDVAVLVVRPDGERSPVAQRSLPPTRISAGVARIWVADLLELWVAAGTLPPGALDPDAADTVQLLVTELVSNAARHSDAPVDLRARLAGSCLRIEVGDNSHRMPMLRRPGLAETSGRGLMLVDTLSTSWGVDLTEHGKTVWFEIDLSAPPPPADIADGVDEDALLAAFGED
jgi:anti-sigma regulatory factor (Ser/Thr protein kinase)